MDMAHTQHAADVVTAGGSMIDDDRAAAAVGAALHALERDAERIAVLGEIGHAGAVVARFGSPAAGGALCRLLAEIDLCSRAGTHTSDGLCDAWAGALDALAATRHGRRADAHGGLPTPGPDR